MSTIWWENSPVVNQEAIALGRPLIGADIGGMKEKIEGIAGLTFSARSASSLAKIIEKAIEPECFDCGKKKLQTSDVIGLHLALVS